jgi:hypothetical protein
LRRGPEGNSGTAFSLGKLYPVFESQIAITLDFKGHFAGALSHPNKIRCLQAMRGSPPTRKIEMLVSYARFTGKILMTERE